MKQLTKFDKFLNWLFSCPPQNYKPKSRIEVIAQLKNQRKTSVEKRTK